MSKVFDRYLRKTLISIGIYFVSIILFLFIWTRFERNVTIPVIIVIYTVVILIFALVFKLKRDIVREVKRIYREKPYMPMKFIASKSGATVEQVESIINQMKTEVKEM